MLGLSKSKHKAKAHHEVQHVGEASYLLSGMSGRWHWWTDSGGHGEVKNRNRVRPNHCHRRSSRAWHRRAAHARVNYTCLSIDR